MQVKALVTTVNQLLEVQQANLEGIHRAFAMVDAHQQVLARVTSDLSYAVTEARRLQVDGDFFRVPGDLGPLKLRQDTDGLLDVEGYHADYRKVVELAGNRADEAVVLWARGKSVEEAVAGAKIEPQVESAVEEPSNPHYQVEYFGGNASGQDHQQQEPSAAQAGG